MPTYTCPKGHASSEADFCSECGARIQSVAPAGSADPVAVPVSAAGSGDPAPCPDCTAPRAGTSSNFCEVCGYNFATGTHGNVPVEAAPLPAPPPEPAPPEPVKQWTLLVAIDPSLGEPGGPEPPANVAPITLKLDKPVNLIGRRSDKRAILPEVSLDLDDAVSHRHALLTCGEDGSLTLRDIGSANGTRLNAVDVDPLVDTALHVGDQITLGRWTRLTVNAG